MDFELSWLNVVPGARVIMITVWEEGDVSKMKPCGANVSRVQQIIN